MRKLLLTALGTTAALAAAATAYAAFTASGISTTSATLTTTQASDTRIRQCTGGDSKAFTITDASFTGTADFTNPAADLDGPLSLRARTIVDNSSKLGYVEGSVRIKDDDTDFHGRLVGTLDAAGKFSGFLTGDTHRGGRAKVFGTLSGTFAGATGFASPGAALGSAPASAAFAVIAGPVCKKERPEPSHPSPPAQKPKRFDIHGTISALSAGPPATITVVGRGPTTATCTLDGSSPSTSGFAVNDKVRMKCESISNVWTLRELKKDGHH